MKQTFGDYDSIEACDPMNSLVTREDTAQVQSIKDSFMSSSEFTEAITTARKGVLPPGVTRRAWLDKDNAFAYAVSVYIPSFTNKASVSGKVMNDARLLKPVETEEPKPSAVEFEAGKVISTVSIDKYDRKPNPTEELKRGVTGTIEQDL